MKAPANSLRLVRLGIDTLHEFVVYIRKDCPVLVSEGFEAQTRVEIHSGKHKIIALLNVIDNESILKSGEVGLSESAWSRLGAQEGDEVTFVHLDPVLSLSYVRAKMYGHRLSEKAMEAIVRDITEGRYSNLHLAAFVVSCAGDRLDIKEISDLTKAMVDSGVRLKWDQPVVADKHSIGGLPGNRTTPIVVPIVAAAGLTIPKTSSRAITSPAGTADVIEVMTKVELSLQEIHEVVRQENACFARGGAVRLSPADDLLISVERALDVDSEGQMIASVLSKKAAAGSTHVVIDIPFGPTAKVRSLEEAEKLKYYFKAVAASIGLKIKVLITDGSQPVGNGIGPALEATDALKVLRRKSDAPKDLRHRALLLSAALLELTGRVREGDGYARAEALLDNGIAMEKFLAICKAQGGFFEPPVASFRHTIKTRRKGIVRAIDNRRLALLAKLAGAPYDRSAGIFLNVHLGDEVRKGDVLFTVFAEAKGELDYALRYYTGQENILTIE